MWLKDKVALITGGASGIGKAAGKLFAREGASVILVDIAEEKGNAAAQEISAAAREFGGQAVFRKCHVGKMAEVAALVSGALTEFGRIDTLFSNAGIYGMKGNATQITEEDWDHVIAVNLKAGWMLAHYIVPAMLKQGGGSIVLTGSVHSKRGYANYCAYQITKNGILGLMRSLAADFCPTIRVNAILPGAFVTGLWEDVPEEVHEHSAQFAPLKRNGDLKEIAQAVLFLASAQSSFMTGQELVIDGGLISIIQKYKKQ